MKCTIIMWLVCLYDNISTFWQFNYFERNTASENVKYG